MEGDFLTPNCAPLVDNYSYIGELLPERQYIYLVELIIITIGRKKSVKYIHMK